MGRGRIGLYDMLLMLPGGIYIHGVYHGKVGDQKWDHVKIIDASISFF